MSRQTLHFAWPGGRVKYELRQPCWRNNNNGACFTPRLRDEIRWRPHLYNSNWKECREPHSKTPEVNYPKHKSFLVLLSLDSIQILHAAGMHGPLQMCAPVHMCRACIDLKPKMWYEWSMCKLWTCNVESMNLIYTHTSSTRYKLKIRCRENNANMKCYLKKLTNMLKASLYSNNQIACNRKGMKMSCKTCKLVFTVLKMSISQPAMFNINYINTMYWLSNHKTPN